MIQNTKRRAEAPRGEATAVSCVSRTCPHTYGPWSRVRPVRAAPAARDVEHRAFIDDVRTDHHRTLAEPPDRVRQQLVAPIARLVSCSSLGLLLGLLVSCLVSRKETKPRPAWYHNRNKTPIPRVLRIKPGFIPEVLYLQVFLVVPYW